MTEIRRSLSLVLIALPPLALSTGASAQETRVDAAATEVVAGRADAQEAADRRIVQSQGTMERSGFVPVAPSFQLSTKTDETEVSIGISAEVGQTGSRRVGDLDHRVSSTTRFSIQGFAPVDEDGEDVFVNLASPLDGARLKFGITRYSSRYVITRQAIEGARTILNRSTTNCLTREVAAWRTGASAEERALADQYVQAYGVAMSQPQARAEEVLDQVNARRVNDELQFGDVPERVRGRCLVGLAEESVDDNEDLIRTYGDGAAVDALARAITGGAPTYFYGLEGTISHKSYSFLDRAGFQLDDDGHVGYQVSAFAGIIGGSGNWSLRAGLSRSQRYSAADEIELCRPVGGAGQSECLSGPDGPPTRTRQTVLSVEGRRLFNTGSSLVPHIGVAPEFAYDFSSDEFSIDVPVYFAPNSDGALTGGVRFGYGSKDDEISFGLFVGVPFTVFQ